VRSRSAGRATVNTMRHIISVTLQNEVGALNRVAGLFSTRGYNIESLSVAPTDDPTVSRLTVVTTGNDAVIQQISNQLLKLVDVVDVEDVTREEHFERELLLIKVKGKATMVGSLWSATQRAGGRVLWDAADSFTVELTSGGDKKIQVIKVVRELTSLGLKEAKDLVDGAPKPVKTGVTKEEADSMKAKLEEQGAGVEIK